MDTKLLIAEAKARFNHNTAKAQLKDKYEAKFNLADQGGLWKADQNTISFLSSFDCQNIVMIDTFDNPVYIDREALLTKLQDTYHAVMAEWLDEWRALENQR
jgi:hypothetical protein